MTSNIPLTIWQCGRCDHEWASRQVRPTICPACKSPYHDRPYVQTMTERERERLRSVATSRVAAAIQSGRLPPPSTQKCTDCDQAAEQYDHRDYRKPLRVAPVCCKCNIARGWDATAFLVTDESFRARRDGLIVPVKEPRLIQCPHCGESYYTRTADPCRCARCARKLKNRKPKAPGPGPDNAPNGAKGDPDAA